VLRQGACLLALLVGITVASVGFAGSALAKDRLFYIGLALYPEPWSQNDVTELADRLHAVGTFDVVPLIASNLATRPRRYPIASDTTIANFVSRVAEDAHDDDVVMVAISTHGSPRVLARALAGQEPTGLSSRGLARRLAPLAPYRTVIVIAACYSGSLIQDLKTPRRIIFTAARVDRASFGCNAESRHSYFGAAAASAFAQPGRSLRDVVAAIRGDVAQREGERQYTPSEPQAWIGDEVATLYDAPLF